MIPPARQPSLDGATVLVATILAIAGSVLFGLAPAWRSTRGLTLDGLHTGRSGSLGAARDRMRGPALVVSEVALALVLLVGSGLLSS